MQEPQTHGHPQQYENHPLVHEDLQATDQPLQTQQVIAVSWYVNLVQDDVRRPRGLGAALLPADYLLLRGLESEQSQVVTRHRSGDVAEQKMTDHCKRSVLFVLCVCAV